LTEFRNIIVNLTTRILKPDEKTRKQPVRAVNKCKQLGIDAPQNLKPDEKEKIRKQPSRSVNTTRLLYPQCSCQQGPLLRFGGCLEEAVVLAVVQMTVLKEQSRCAERKENDANDL
jgi:hypothetical protein